MAFRLAMREGARVPPQVQGGKAKEGLVKESPSGVAGKVFGVLEHGSPPKSFPGTSPALAPEAGSARQCASKEEAKGHRRRGGSCPTLRMAGRCVIGPEALRRVARDGASGDGGADMAIALKIEKIGRSGYLRKTRSASAVVIKA